jgi:hypothetical protein
MANGAARISQIAFLGDMAIFMWDDDRNFAGLPYLVSICRREDPA